MFSNGCDISVPCKLSLIELGSKFRIFDPRRFHLIYLLIWSLKRGKADNKRSFSRRWREFRLNPDFSEMEGFSEE